MEIRYFLILNLLFTIIYNLPLRKYGKQLTVIGEILDTYSSPISNIAIQLSGKYSDRKIEKGGNHKVTKKTDVQKTGIVTTIKGLVEEPENIPSVSSINGIYMARLRTIEVLKRQADSVYLI